MGRIEEYAQADLAVPEPGLRAISALLGYSLLYGMMYLLVRHTKVRLVKRSTNISMELQKKITVLIIIILMIMSVADTLK